MARPQIDDGILDRLEEVVDRRANVPAEHLTNSQRLGFALDQLAEADRQVEHLTERVNQLEARLEKLREKDTQQEMSMNLGNSPNRRF